ncbi:HlyD family efflux transporter periplasmic adaptor subunit [Psychrobacter sp. APC 3281]|uniref:efflux RND transporter periplasmic adaptor subunit n=1 Tax=Psychrobacter sp. APC 3281 TaxID=3035190 RepID=UPI0025B2F1F1|nr:HlyD family efflux transporter periplasmic adaptor subunit [Psychrobacter sp. APC 3281]MDN3448028.1 HlyD family efflux transporter periplasmic adaptor subunit [Psychrobacter sp. APC 3281]
MTASRHLRKSLYLFSVLFIAACQPSPINESTVTDTEAETADTPLIITSDSVTMTPEHILSIKPSRYQPSLGLQGNIEPIKQTTFVAVHPIRIEETLVSEGQWVEKGTPLLVFRRIGTASKAEGLNKPEQVSLESGDANQNNPENTQNSDSNPVQAEPDTDIAVVRKTDSKSYKTLEANSAIDTDSNISTNQGADVNTAKQDVQYNSITIHASFSGRVENLSASAGQQLAARDSLLQISDETKLHFMATLPIQAKPQLSVGQTVNFTAEGISDKFTGQVSKLVSTSQPKKLLVYVNVIDNEVSRDKLLPNMKVTGRVNYGQIDVGTIVPKRALHDVDLTELQTPPYMPLQPLTANVWIIGQDQRLTRQPIEVVEYDPTTQQYLIAGVSNDSLICLADLPVDSKGKKVIVS